MEKEWDIEVPLPYSANRDMAFKEKLGEIILAFNKPAFDKYGDILQDSSLMNCDVNPTKQKELFMHYKLNNTKAYQPIQKELYLHSSQATIWILINEQRGILCNYVLTQ